MSNGNWPEFGNVPECPKGFVPGYKLEAALEEKREYRRLWQEACIERDEVLAHETDLINHMRLIKEAGDDLLHGELFDPCNRDINGLLCMGTDDRYCVDMGNKLNVLLRRIE